MSLEINWSSRDSWIGLMWIFRLHLFAIFCASTWKFRITGNVIAIFAFGFFIVFSFFRIGMM